MEKPAHSRPRTYPVHQNQGFPVHRIEGKNPKASSLPSARDHRISHFRWTPRISELDKGRDQTTHNRINLISGIFSLYLLSDFDRIQMDGYRILHI
jgi:hypothetical protein